MKTINLTLPAILFSQLLIAGCTEKSTDARIAEKQLSDQFPTVISATDTSIAPQSIINIEDWTACNSEILCQSSNTDRLFYRLDPATFCTVDSFGTNGQGPDEFIFPKIVRSNNGATILVDIAKNKFISNDVETIVSPNEYGYNSPFDVAYPIVGFTELIGRDRACYLIDVNTSEIVDSISFKSSEMPSPKIAVNFRAASNGRHVVIVREFLDEIIIIDLDKNNSFDKITRYKGQGQPSARRPYYVGVECGKDRFYVMSMIDVSFGSNGEPSGKCSIDIYDYAATPVAKIEVNYFPRRILLDADRNRLLALSAFDDDIHIIDLPRLLFE